MNGIIEIVAEAIAFLNKHGMEVISTPGGFIVREAGFEAEGFELTCDSVEEVISFAQNECDIIIGMAGCRMPESELLRSGCGCSNSGSSVGGEAVRSNNSREVKT